MNSLLSRVSLLKLRLLFLLGLGIFGGVQSYGQNIAFAMHTVHKGTLKITAQLTAQTGNYPTTASLEVNNNGKWTEVAMATVIKPGWTAPFKVTNWDQTKDIDYRVVYNGSNWAGVIRKDPVDKDVIIVAAFTGNDNGSAQGGNLSKGDIINNMIVHSPDLLVFTGDQVYPHSNHLRHWLTFGKTFGELFRDIPVVSLPDDHDVGQGNLFGEGGIKASGVNGYNKGGYKNSAAYVKEVERAQTSHLPDPFDPTPVAQGIGVYYTDLTVGGINFAIIEDRKFKTGAEGVVPDSMWTASGRPDHIKLNTPGYTPAVVDVPSAILLGQRQLNFLDVWAQDWTGGVEMKSVLSATIFASSATHHKSDGELIGDLDSNGWPQTGRNKALKLIRKAFANMIGGDQHLASMIHHGVDEWGDAGYSLCVPSIANYYSRSWFPDSVGGDRQPGMPTYIGSVVPKPGGLVGTVSHAITGNYHDGFGNKITVWAVGNPEDQGRTPVKLLKWSPGYGIVKYDKKNRKITMENWPRNADPTKDAQYEGWPLTVTQEDNYGRKASHYLPTLSINTTNPVVQVINEQTKEVVYTLRISGNTFRPKVFQPGTYTVKVGEIESPSKSTVLTKVTALNPSVDSTLVVRVTGTSIRPNKKMKSLKNKTQITWNKSLKKVTVVAPNKLDYSIEIVNAKGVVKMSRKLKGPGLFKMSIPHLKSGLYVVRVTSKQSNVQKKLTVTQ